MSSVTTAPPESLLASLVQEVEPWKAHLLANPDLFIVRYFPDAIQRLEPFHLRLIETATTEEKGLILYPAAHGKTTLVSTLLPIWALCKDPNIRIGIIAKNEQEAKAIMRALQAELLSNEQLIEDFGPFYSEDRRSAWSLERLEVAKRTSRHKSATIAVFGAGSRNTLGYRTDWTILDDVVTQENSATPEQRFKLRQWFNQGPRTMCEQPGDRMTVVGTLFDPEDLYHDLVEMRYPDTGEPVYHVQREDAIVDEEKHLTLWPARWPWRRLMEMKGEMGTLDFNKRYRNIAVDRSRMVFKEAYIKGGWEDGERYEGCLDESFNVGDFDPAWLRYSGFDPAVGLSRHAKFCAHCTIAVGSCKEHERCYWVIDLAREQLTLPQQADLVLDRHQQYALTESVIETNSYQGGLQQLIEERMNRDGLALAIRPFTTNRINKHEYETGVQAMAPWFENGKVHIPWGNQESRRKMGKFVDELIQYPSGRTSDTVMAFWFAWRAAQTQAPTFKSTNRLKRMAWNQQGRKRVVKNPFYVRNEAA